MQTRIETDVRGLKELRMAFSQSPDRARKYTWRAVHDTAKWASRREGIEVAEATNIPRRVFTRTNNPGRVRFGTGRESYIRVGWIRGTSLPSGRSWLGSKSVKAHHIGTPKKFSYGVRVGKHKLPGAFIGKGIGGGGPFVFRRKKGDWNPRVKDAHYKPNIGRRKERLELVKVDIERQSEMVARSVAQRAVGMLDEQIHRQMDLIFRGL
jgi:hypothetical protein